jgi:hypothetical protein
MHEDVPTNLSITNKDTASLASLFTYQILREMSIVQEKHNRNMV